METRPLALQLPDPNLKIRPVLLTDAPPLQYHCWPHRSVPLVERLLARAQRIAQQGRGLGVVVDIPDEGALAYGQLTLWPHCAEISDLMVSESYRGHGYGTAIIQYLMRTAREMDVACVDIGAAASNTGALALYRRLGFEDHRVVMMNVGGQHEEVIYLRLDLSGGNAGAEDSGVR